MLNTITNILAFNALILLFALFFPPVLYFVIFFSWFLLVCFILSLHCRSCILCLIFFCNQQKLKNYSYQSDVNTSTPLPDHGRTLEYLHFPTVSMLLLCILMISIFKLKRTFLLFSTLNIHLDLLTYLPFPVILIIFFICELSSQIISL